MNFLNLLEVADFIEFEIKRKELLTVLGLELPRVTDEWAYVHV
jgi:hypothetical protein